MSHLHREGHYLGARLVIKACADEEDGLELELDLVFVEVGNRLNLNEPVHALGCIWIDARRGACSEEDGFHVLVQHHQMVGDFGTDIVLALAQGLSGPQLVLVSRDRSVFVVEIVSLNCVACGAQEKLEKGPVTINCWLCGQSVPENKHLACGIWRPAREDKRLNTYPSHRICLGPTTRSGQSHHGAHLRRCLV